MTENAENRTVFSSVFFDDVRITRLALENRLIFYHKKMINFFTPIDNKLSSNKNRTDVNQSFGKNRFLSENALRERESVL